PSGPVIVSSPIRSLSVNCFDPRFRIACDLYNAGLRKLIQAAQKNGQLDPRQELRLPCSDGLSITLSLNHYGFQWKPEEFGPLLLCQDYDVVALENLYRGYGLGVPLIGVRAKIPSPWWVFYPQEVTFPVTAFFRFEGCLADIGNQTAGRLELYN